MSTPPFLVDLIPAVQAQLLAQVPTWQGRGVTPLTDVLDAEPLVPDCPVIYLLFDTGTREQRGQVTTLEYQIIARLVLPWQEVAAAEHALWPYVNAVPAAVDVDATFGRVLNRAARAGAPTGGIYPISKVFYRVLDTPIYLPAQGAYRSGI